MKKILQQIKEGRYNGLAVLRNNTDFSFDVSWVLGGDVVEFLFLGARREDEIYDIFRIIEISKTRDTFGISKELLENIEENTTVAINKLDEFELEDSKVFRKYILGLPYPEKTIGRKSWN